MSIRLSIFLYYYTFDLKKKSEESMIGASKSGKIEIELNAW